MHDYVYEEINVGGLRRNVSLGIYMKERLHATSRVEVYDSDAFGRCLYLDGALQLTEKDEHIYHEAIAHIPVLLCNAPKNVLIIGGGDGGTLREVLKHNGVEKVVLCEINPDVIDASKKFMPTLELEKSLKDPRVKLIIQDANEFLSPDKLCGIRYDVIIIDCNDPTPDSNVLYSREFLETQIVPLLKIGAVLAIQAGNAYIKENFVRSLRYELQRLFKGGEVAYFYVPIPSYPSGGIGFFFAKFESIESIGAVELPTKWLKWRTAEAGFMMAPTSLSINHRKNAYDWICDVQFDFDSKLRSEEREVVRLLCGLEDEPRDSERQFDFMTTDLNSISFQIMTLDGVPSIQPAIKEMMRVRKEKLPFDIPINGVGFACLGMKDYGQIVQYISVQNLEWVRVNLPQHYERKPEICYDLVEVAFMCLGGTNSGVRVTYSDLSRRYHASVTNVPDVITDYWNVWEESRVRTDAKTWKLKFKEKTLKQLEICEKQGLVLCEASVSPKWDTCTLAVPSLSP